MSANDRQEGGTHYQTGDKPQHWDLAIMYRWDAFQYQITKYVMRWKDKHDSREQRLTDLKKARHFLDKYIENFEVYDSGVKPKFVIGVDPGDPKGDTTVVMRIAPMELKELTPNLKDQCKDLILLI